MKISFLIFVLSSITYVNCQTKKGAYYSTEQKIVVSNFVSTNVKETKPTYISFQITKTLRYSYFYMSDAPRPYPQNQNKTWSKDFKILQAKNNLINCKDPNGNFVDFVFDEFSAQPSITMRTYKDNTLAKEIIYYIDN